ncbi:hypothetical protein E2C01_030508 [Portunus trituberculatus]|uniref:Uncharacterized protein n=1 Tax=Portunus trituberculatus TaxID=210409 RepID=A0A5B7EV16_PORTR|nr:hypothetical protein [Portunus trituberculatus]
MGQVSKRNKQRKDAWNMSMEAQRIKRQRVEPDTSDTPVHILTSHTTTTLTTTTPQPTTSHAEQRKGNEEEKAS